MPTNTRREKIQTLNNLLDACRKLQIGYRTPAIADRITELLRPLGFGMSTEKEYVRMVVDALQWEDKNQKEFRFAD